MLLILISLKNNGGKRTIATDTIWSTEMSVASIEASISKELQRIGLTASQGASGIEIKIVDMNISSFMSL